jgi:hypothetical protein
MYTKQLISYLSVLSIALSFGLITLSATPAQAQVKSEKTTTVSSDVELPLRLQINFETKDPDEG